MSEYKPWLKQPGECHDKHGLPIHPGDLLKTPHFRGPRRKMYYLYHVAVFDLSCNAMRMIPTAHLDETLRVHPDHRGGSPLLSDDIARDCEVISGVGVDGKLWNERPRMKWVKAAGDTLETK